MRKINRRLPAGEVVERWVYDEDVDMLEINISCPNVKEAESHLDRIRKRRKRLQAKAVKKYAKQPVIIEVESQCDRYFRDGKGFRSRRVAQMRSL